MSPDNFEWRRGLPHERVGAQKLGMSLETREIKLFWRDIPGFCWDIPPVPEKFENKKVCVHFLAPIFVTRMTVAYVCLMFAHCCACVYTFPHVLLRFPFFRQCPQLYVMWLWNGFCEASLERWMLDSQFLINSLHTRCIVETGVVLQGAFVKSGDLLNLKVFLVEFLENRRS